MKLVIIGSVKARAEDTKPIIREVLDRLKPDIVGSGKAKGTDTHAEEVCVELNVEFKGFPPDHRSWHGTLLLCGYKCRNMKMVKWGDHFIRIACKRSTTYGSGWTADRASESGKPVEQYVVD